MRFLVNMKSLMASCKTSFLSLIRICILLQFASAFLLGLISGCTERVDVFTYRALNRRSYDRPSWSKKWRETDSFRNSYTWWANYKPIVTDKTVYIVTPSSLLLGYNLFNGRLSHSIDLGHSLSPASSHVLTNGELISSYFRYTSNGLKTYISRYSIRDKKCVWTTHLCTVPLFSTTSYFRNIVVSPARIFINTLDFGVYALDSAKGKVLWHHDTVYRREKWGSDLYPSKPVLSGDTLFIIGNRAPSTSIFSGSDIEKLGLFAIDATTGTLRKRFEIEEESTVFNIYKYVVIYDQIALRFYSVNDLQLVWEKRAKLLGHNQVRVVIEDNDQILGLCPRQKTLEWSFTKPVGKLYMTKDLILFSQDIETSCQLVAYDLNTGSLLWKTAFSNCNASRFVVADSKESLAIAIAYTERDKIDTQLIVILEKASGKQLSLTRINE